MRWMQFCILIVLHLVAGLAAGASFEFFDRPVGTPATWASFEFDDTGDHLACNFEGRLYLWTSSAGFQSLGRGHANSSSVGISGDGSTLCASRERSSDGYLNASIWKQGQGWRDLGHTMEGCIKGDSWGSGFDLNHDGSQAVGLAWTCQGGQAFHWSRATGMVGLSPGLNQPTSRATAMADDGGLIIGFLHHPQLKYRRPAWWGADGQINLYGGPVLRGEALNVDSTGQMVVGYHLEDKVEQAHFWTADEGVVSLGSLSGMSWDSSRATHVSDQGEIFGFSTHSGWGISEAFVWDRFDGMVRLQDHLEEQGASLPDNIWLDRVLALSSDGSTILGSWTNAQNKSGYWLAHNSNHLKGRIRECLALADGSGLEFRFEISDDEFEQKPLLVANQGSREWTVPLKIDGRFCVGTDHQANLLETGEVVYTLAEPLGNGLRTLDRISIWSDQKNETRDWLSGTLFRPTAPEADLWLRLSKPGHLKISVKDETGLPAPFLSDRDFEPGLHRIPWQPATAESDQQKSGQHILIRWQ